VAVAGPENLAVARDKYKQAAQLAADDDNDKALALVEDGLQLVPKDLPLLELRGSLLLKTRDYTGALAAYQAYVDAGATGANRRAAQKIVASLSAVRTTFVAITVTNGPASIYLDAKSQGLFCTGDATEGCKKGILPGDYKLIAEREGFERWTGRVDVAASQTAKVAVTLIEKPSALQLHVAPDGATLALDGNALAAAPATVPGGDHELTVSRDGFATATVPVQAHLGAPVAVEVALVPLVPLAVSPADATLLLDGVPAVVERGGVAVPAGAHALVARAAKYHDQTVVIPADRGADYKVAVALAPVGALLDVAGAPAGASIVVDGKRVATTPLTAPVEVPPGDHAVEVRASGFRPVHQQAAFAGDGQAHLRVGALRPDNRLRAWLVTGATVVALGVGGYASGMAVVRNNQYDTQARQAGVTPDDPTLRAIASSGRGWAAGADVGLGLGIIGVAATTYLFLHEGRGWSEGSLQVGIAPNGLAVAKRF
jgi:hypothetical protein